jgi:hypothetical protein
MDHKEIGSDFESFETFEEHKFLHLTLIQIPNIRFHSVEFLACLHYFRVELLENIPEKELSFFRISQSFLHCLLSQKSK